MAVEFPLKTDYQDDILDLTQNSQRKFEEIVNEDGSKSFRDVTVYEREGDNYGKNVVNEQNEAINMLHTLLFSMRSHIGMIVQSTTLDTEEKVIAIYGGTSWSKIEGKFLLGQSSNHAVNTTGGSETVTLNINQIPSHGHDVRFSNRHDNSIFDDYGNVNQGNYYSTSFWKSSGGNGCTTAPSTPLIALPNGGGQAHNNMPPYKTVYIWERTA